MNKNKETTKQRLIDAVGKILVEKGGFQGIGINAIAREAGVDKVLIYRYFENLDGLLYAYAAQKDYISNLPNVLGEDLEITSKAEAIEVSKRIFTEQIQQILHNRELQEILLWELSCKNRITDAIAETRERQGRAVLEKMNELIDFNSVDLPAIGSIIFGGIYYLILRSRTIDEFNGMQLKTEESWQRIEHAITYLLDRLAEQL